MRRLVWWGPPLLSAAIVLYIALVPPYASLRETMTAIPATQSSPARVEIRTESPSPLRQSVPLIPVLIPVVLSALPLLGRDVSSRRRIAFVGASLLAAYCLIASFSIGMFFVPSLLLMMSAFLIDAPAREAQPSPEATS